ncbi:MAG: TIGR03905 family TSCPD domain-containing protein [Clostridia bacterium]
MKYSYQPKGVCSREMIFEIENGIVVNLQVIGGCQGNLQGISKLVQGMHIEEIIGKLKGIDCKGRGTSCPDQIVQALEQFKKEMKE